MGIKDQFQDKTQQMQQRAKQKKKRGGGQSEESQQGRNPQGMRGRGPQGEGREVEDEVRDPGQQSLDDLSDEQDR